MHATVVIPVWNGEAVISACLESLFANSGEGLSEVICVDNASRDGSAAVIAERHSEARLLRQPTNFGFAGGANIGIGQAKGELLILLNQDCMVQPGWLESIVSGYELSPQAGIAGCTIVNTDGSIDHAGARIRRPDAYGEHLRDIGDDQPRQVDYVTGAVFAIMRSTWSIVGEFDEGFYPAYYEESDYCYRARQRGIETIYVPGARATHVFSSREWQTDGVRHTSNQHRARYRFVCKHFNSSEATDFFEAELEAVEKEPYFEHVFGRTIGARDTIRSMAEIMARRRSDLGVMPSPALRRQLINGFNLLLSRSVALSAASRIGIASSTDALGWQEGMQHLRSLQSREHDLLSRIYFRSPSASPTESTVRRLIRLFLLRPLSFLVGRDYLLQSELNTIHVARMDLLNDMFQRTERRMALLESLYHDYR